LEMLLGYIGIYWDILGYIGIYWCTEIINIYHYLSTLTITNYHSLATKNTYIMNICLSSLSTLSLTVINITMWGPHDS
jgi:hypothetical protein